MSNHKGHERLSVLEVSYSRQVWGAELAMMALARPLAERGIDLTLGSPPGGDLEEHWRRLDLPFVPLALPDHLGIRAADRESRPTAGSFVREFATTARSVWTIGRVVRDFDLVHSNSLWSHLDCALAGRMACRPVVVELNDLVRRGIGSRILTAAAGLSTTAVAISQAVADCVGHGSARHLCIVSPAVDLERFAPGPGSAEMRRKLTSDVDAPLVGIVGRIDPEKGVDVLVRAIGLLRDEAAHAHLVVVGSAGLAPDGYSERLRAEAERSLGDRVRFVGRMQDVPGTLRALDVLVNASVAEPFGLSVLEAQATGVTVVATRAGGITDFVFDGDNGLLVPSGDVDELAKALERLVTDQDLRARLAQRALVTAQSRGIDARADAIAAIHWRAARRSQPERGDR